MNKKYRLYINNSINYKLNLTNVKATKNANIISILYRFEYH